VASAVVTLEALPSSEAFDDLAALEVITAAAFGQRRKMLRSSLAQATAQVGMTPEALLAAADITPTLRAEEVPVAGFHRLARAWRANAT
jgi:16S rRNA (adenine1518-N6/adenine1519-N6)-dimethyltransferase